MDGPDTRPQRRLMVVNSRFLVFPWVRSKNLASSALAMATRRLADDWERIHGHRPVLCETFIDETRFRASCCRAANWNAIGGDLRQGKDAQGRLCDAALRGRPRDPVEARVTRDSGSLRPGPKGAASAAAGRRLSRPPRRSRRARTRAGRSAAACSTAC